MQRIAKEKPTIADILSITDPTDLRTLGPFAELKIALNALLGLNVSAKSWASLYRTIRRIQAITRREAQLRQGDTKSVSDAARKRLSTLLQNGSRAGRRSQAPGGELTRAIAVISEAASDPKVKYRFQRSRNFVHSSRLEGIRVRASGHSASLESILNKHRKK